MSDLQTPRPMDERRKTYLRLIAEICICYRQRCGRRAARRADRRHSAAVHPRVHHGVDVQPRHRVASAPPAPDAQTVFLYSGARVLCPAVRSVPVLRRSARLAGHRSGAQRADLHRRFAGAVQRAGHVAARGARQASRRIRGRGRRNLFPAQQRVGMAENPALRRAQLCDGHLPQRRAGSAELRHLPDGARAGQLHHHGGFPEPARKHLQLPSVYAAKTPSA